MIANVGSLLSEGLLVGALLLLCKLKDSPEFSLPPKSHGGKIPAQQEFSFVLFNHSTKVQAILSYYGTSNDSVEDLHFKLKPDF